MHRAALALSLLAVTFTSTAHAQGWRWLSPKPQGVGINAVSFVGTQGWLAGAVGTIATTTDGATTFQPQVSGVTADLYGVFFLNATQGWAVGDLGTILVTSNGGQTWTPQTSGTTRKLHGVWFTDALNGLAVGDFRTLLQTANGGVTWTGRGTSALSLDGITFTDSLHGYICGANGIITQTSDGGNTFTDVQTPSMGHLLAIAFADTLHGWAVGEGGAIVATSDGGQSWVVQNLTTTQNLVGLVVSSDSAVTALGDGGGLYTTVDGQTWTSAELVSGSALFTDLVVEPGGALDAVAQNGQWLRAALGGVPPILPVFADVNDGLPRTATVTSMAFGSFDAGVLVVDEYLYATQDRGQHLTLVGPPDAGEEYGWLAVAMPSATDAYAVGIDGTAAVSHDQGQTWALLDLPAFEDLQGIEFLPDSGIGFVLGVLGTVLSTTNGGQTWTTLESGVSTTFNAAAFLDPQHGVVGGQYTAEPGTLDWTVDGTTFQPSNLDFFGNVTGLAYPANGVALVCADDGTLAHSTDQGLNFYALETPLATMGFGALAFVSRQNGWLAGNAPQGNIWVTSDGAQSFGLQFQGTQNIQAFSFLDALHGYAAGAGGTLLLTDTAGGPGCAQESDCVDAGFAGITCVSGACIPCTTDDRCTANCTPCAPPNAYCYGAYCAACENDSQCQPGYCVLGQCQISTVGDGGTSSTSSGTSSGGSTGSGSGGASGAGASGGSSSGAGTNGSTGGCPPNEAYCSTSGCGCGSAGAGPVVLLGTVLLAFRVRRRRA